MVNDEGELGWLRHLPEVGTLARMADREQELLDQRATLIGQINALDHRLSDLRNDALRQARKGWGAAEISAAQSIDAA